MDKNTIADILSEIGTILEIKGENPFKVRAYHAGARALETLQGDLGVLIADNALKDVPGIGEAIAEKITTLHQTGKLKFYDTLRDSLPPGLLTMMEIPGVGPKKVKALWEELGIDSIPALQKACEDGSVAALKGFGQKTCEKILIGIRNREAYSKRHLWPIAAEVALPILEGLRALKGVVHAESAGSLRRHLETVGDLDFLVAAADPAPVMDWFTSLPDILEVTAKGDTKSSVRFSSGLQADLRVVPEEQFFFALHHFTGSKDHNVAMRHRALQHGLSLSEWGITPKDANVTAPKAKSEADIFAALGLPYIPPELREGLGEIEAAEANKLPNLVTLADLRGAFHNHTIASDGTGTLEEMAKAAESMGWEYLGIADHSKSSFQANGLTEARLAEQVESIRKLNAEKRLKIRLFAGSEVDILKDGTLDFDDSVLARLDYVVASVHNRSTPDADAMTARIIRALENPYVTMLGHLTGRLLLFREPYPVHAQKVIDAAIANKKIIELNATPLRLDMDWRLWRRAAERGLLCSINPDAHATEQLRYVANGVAAARKGWLEPRHILNCRTLAEVLKYFGKK
ncbi:MAG: DNA polymerase/3'-5' exonuclease PolX [Puniceicoccales bacterium]|jgi:DNA polymerase (family 10)|nr:DNA polymerase/3'-5' exonuclease PolX [Puniceicoccales bacterium]